MVCTSVQASPPCPLMSTPGQSLNAPSVRFVLGGGRKIIKLPNNMRPFRCCVNNHIGGWIEGEWSDFGPLIDIPKVAKFQKKFLYKNFFSKKSCKIGHPIIHAHTAWQSRNHVRSVNFSKFRKKLHFWHFFLNMTTKCAFFTELEKVAKMNTYIFHRFRKISKEIH